MQHMLKSDQKKDKEIDLFHCHPIFNEIQRLDICKLDTITFPKQL